MEYIFGRDKSACVNAIKANNPDTPYRRDTCVSPMLLRLAGPYKMFSEAPSSVVQI